MDVFILLGVIFTTCLLSIFYMVYSSKLNFSIKTILREFAKRTHNEELFQLVELSVRKVNGWNRMTMFYTILHYVLNIWSITFSCISIYYSFGQQGNLSISSSIVAILSVTCNLFLRSDRKWGIFRDALAKGRIETNNFISEFTNAQNLAEFTKNYANKIIEIELSLSNSDIS